MVVLQHDLVDPELYVYSRVMDEASKKFVIGDYIKFYTASNYDECNRFTGKITFFPVKDTTFRIRSKLGSQRFDVEVESIYKVTKVLPSYIEVSKLLIEENGNITLFDPETLRESMYLDDTVSSFLYNDDESNDLEKCISTILEKALVLDPDYRDWET